MPSSAGRISFKTFRRSLVSPVLAVYTAPMFPIFSQSDVEAAADALIAWFAAHKRPLPWRVRYTPYEVWISEVMLQQTQMERGVAYFQRWMKRFPSVTAVAEAPEEEILRYWEGLGYYRRARFLHQAAKAMVEKHGGQIPATLEELSALPGLGEYTVAAILGIAYEKDIVTIDANVERVFSRLLNIDTPVKKHPAAAFIRQEVRRFLPSGQARLYNQALMELGATVCIPNGKPLCEACPVMHLCRAFHSGAWQQIPVKAAGKKERQIRERTVFVLKREDRYGIRKREEKGLLAGLWELPGMESRLGIEEAGNYLKKLGYAVKGITPLGEAKHIFSHMEWHMTGYLADLGEDEKTESAWNPEFVKDSEAYGEGIPGVRFFHRDEIIRKYSLPSAFDAYKKQFLKEKDDQDSEF